MRLYAILPVFLLLVSGILPAQHDGSAKDQTWSRWRGPGATGVAPAGNPPVEWSEDLNIKWKTAIPGTGHSTPVIWGDQLILLSAVPTDKTVKPAEQGAQEGNQWLSPNSTDRVHKFVVISISRSKGTIEWIKTVREELPHSSTHQFGSWASNSPVTDGQHIYAYFGSHGLYCLNMAGELQWEHDFGPMEKVMSFGEGSSPALYQEKLIILRDHQGQSSLHVLDKHSGTILWEVERDEVSSWSTPTVVEFEGRTQLITSATGRIRSYDIDNGKIIWECSGMTRNVIPSPVYADGMVYLMSGFRGNALLAIDLRKASGDITGTDAIVWSYDQNTPYTPSPVLMDNRLYFLKANNGYLSCLDARNGKVYYSNQKLDGIKEIFTSPLGANGRIYVIGTDGNSCLVRAGDEFQVLAQNRLDDSFYASPVVLGDQLYLRGVKSLYCISE